jgi:GntR family transcriptional regulator/MocR family aminotransferase
LRHAIEQTHPIPAALHALDRPRNYLQTGKYCTSSYGAENLTSTPVDLLVSVDRGNGRTLGRQIEDQLRGRIREGSLRRGTRLPSTRDLASELGVSRPIVVEAYAQLAAEGFLEVRQGSRPRVADCAGLPTSRPAADEPLVREPRVDFRPGVPDLSARLGG